MRLLRGWMGYFQHTSVQTPLKDIDAWIRRRLRCVVWEHLKRNWARYLALMRQGLNEERARRSAFNQRSAWWNSGASHMNQAYPARYFEELGFVSLVQLHKSFQH